jgi:hypothetical protein
VFVWADRAFFSASGFTARTSVALAQEPVQSRLAEVLTEHMAEGRPRLEAARPLLAIVVEGVLASSQFRGAVGDAAEALHTQLFAEHDGRLLLRVRGLVEEVRDVLAIVAPDLAPDLPALDTVEADVAGASDARARLLDVAKKVDLLAYVLPGLTLVAFGTAVYVSRNRGQAVMDAGIAIAAVAGLVLVLLFAGRILLTESVQHPENVEAVKAIWSTFTRPLQDLAWVTMALGALVYFSARTAVGRTQKTPIRIDTH